MTRSWYPIEIRHEQTEIAEQHSYDVIYATDGIRQRDSFYLWFLELVKRSGRGKLLDVSCGEGIFLDFARQVGFLTVGVDFSRTALDKASHITPFANVALANAQRLPFLTDSFDYVTNIGSLEHYFDPGQAVREMARVLRPDGVAFILLPNTFGLFGNIVHVLRHGEVYDDKQPLQRYASRASWEQLLRAHGLVPDQVVPYEREIPRTLADLLWTLQRPSKLLRIIISPLVPTNLSHMLIFICHKSPT